MVSIFTSLRVTLPIDIPLKNLFRVLRYQSEPWINDLIPGMNSNDIRCLETRCLTQFDFVIAIGSACQQFLIHNFSIAEFKITVVNAPLCPQVFDMPPPTIRTYAPVEVAMVEAEVCFVSVGTVCPRKGQLTLIEGLSSLEPRPPGIGKITVEFVGDLNADEAYSRRCIQAASSLATPWMRVSFIGVLSQEDTLRKIQSCDAFLFASLFESFGLAPLEAATIGVPLITTACGVLPEVLESDSTLWVADNDWNTPLSTFFSTFSEKLLAKSAIRNSVDLRKRGVGLLQSEAQKLHCVLQNSR